MNLNTNFISKVERFNRGHFVPTFYAIICICKFMYHYKSSTQYMFTKSPFYILHAFLCTSYITLKSYSHMKSIRWVNYLIYLSPTSNNKSINELLKLCYNLTFIGVVLLIYLFDLVDKIPMMHFVLVTCLSTVASMRNNLMLYLLL